MRQRDAVADRRGRRSLPGQKEPQEQLAVDALRKRQHLDQGPKAPFLVGVLEPVEDPAGFQGLRQARARLVFRLQVVEHLQRRP